ncbi:MAG: polyphosphate polymerase domain-containing protein [Bacteroidales bacterium]|nr:polyphosphate polymerase domain-containing protein [Bacteroidales bacterium]
MSSLHEILQLFEPVRLEQLDSVKLLNRVDTKFLLQADILPDILKSMQKDYFVLEINSSRICHYNTIYLDTPEFYFYNQHQTGRLERVKIRVRTYLETGKSFLEIKTKNNHSKKAKDRISISGIGEIKCKKYQKFLQKKTDKTKILNPVIEVLYSRITLVNREFTERLTIDTDLSYKNDNKSIQVSNLCIIELKQDKTAKSPVRKVLRDKRIFVSSLSKYCLGIASLYPQVKQNNIKEKIRNINKICYENV